MEDKKVGRLGGSKVSQIANIFQQGMAPNKDTSAEYIAPRATKPTAADSPTLEKESDAVKDSPTQVTVMRTESHLARFNNARALFEKLGEESKTVKPAVQERFVPLQNTRSASNLTDVRSRSSSGHSESSTSPVHAKDTKGQLTSRSPSPDFHKSAILKSSVHSNSVPVLNTNCANVSSHSNGVNGVSADVDLGVAPLDDKTTTSSKSKANGAVEKTVKENVNSGEMKLDDRTKPNVVLKKPERPEKPERKFNSRELIEKQRNWTSHFSKARSSRYNSDPNKSEVRLGISNGSKDRNEDNKNTTQPVGQPAMRSASFSARLRSPPTSPPPPPIRTEASRRPNVVRRDRPASVIPTTTPASPTKSTNSVEITATEHKITDTSLRSPNKLHSPPHEPTRPLSSSSLSPKSPHSATKSPSEEPTKENLSATSGSLSSLSSPSSPSRVRTEEEKQERESNEKSVVLDNSTCSLQSQLDMIYGEYFGYFVLTYFNCK